MTAPMHASQSSLAQACTIDCMFEPRPEIEDDDALHRRAV